jgi:hypothetical protein
MTRRLPSRYDGMTGEERLIQVLADGLVSMWQRGYQPTEAEVAEAQRRLDQLAAPSEPMEAAERT